MLQTLAIRSRDQRHRMDLQTLSQSFYGSDAWHLVALFNAADVPSARCKEHVFLRYAPRSAQYLKRATKVSFGSELFSGRHPPISAQ